jgi:predicted nucleic acid-binding protein
VRVFLDTNVLVSAFAARGLCADTLELVLLEHELVGEALTGRSTLFVTGDAALIKLGTIGDLPIVSPPAFLGNVAVSQVVGHRRGNAGYPAAASDWIRSLARCPAS